MIHPSKMWTCTFRFLLHSGLFSITDSSVSMGTCSAFCVLNVKAACQVLTTAEQPQWSFQRGDRRGKDNRTRIRQAHFWRNLPLLLFFLLSFSLRALLSGLGVLVCTSLSLSLPCCHGSCKAGGKRCEDAGELSQCSFCKGLDLHSMFIRLFFSKQIVSTGAEEYRTFWGKGPSS